MSKAINKYYIKDGFAYLLLENFNKEVVGETIIDLELLPDVLSYAKWCSTNPKISHVYARCHYKKEFHLLHRFVTKLTDKNLVIDHINGNTLDNRLSNLRICSQADNVQNITKLHSHNTCGVRGIWFDKTRNKWVAELRISGKSCKIKRFDNKSEAEQCIKYARSITSKYSSDYVNRVEIHNSTPEWIRDITKKRLIFKNIQIIATINELIY